MIDLKLLTTRAPMSDGRALHARGRGQGRPGRKLDAGADLENEQDPPPPPLVTHSERSTVCLGEITISLGRWSLATHSELPTVCLGEIAISLGRLVLFLLIQNDLHCLLMKSPSL